jgi:hypothetical protein
MSWLKCSGLKNSSFGIRPCEASTNPGCLRWAIPECGAQPKHICWNRREPSHAREPDVGGFSQQLRVAQQVWNVGSPVEALRANAIPQEDIAQEDIAQPAVDRRENLVRVYDQDRTPRGSGQRFERIRRIEHGAERSHESGRRRLDITPVHVHYTRAAGRRELADRRKSTDLPTPPGP